MIQTRCLVFVSNELVRKTMLGLLKHFKVNPQSNLLKHKKLQSNLLKHTVNPQSNLLKHTVHPQSKGNLLKHKFNLQSNLLKHMVNSQSNLLKQKINLQSNLLKQNKGIELKHMATTNLDNVTNDSQWEHHMTNDWITATVEDGPLSVMTKDVANEKIVIVENGIVGSEWRIVSVVNVIVDSMIVDSMIVDSMIVDSMIVGSMDNVIVDNVIVDNSVMSRVLEIVDVTAVHVQGVEKSETQTR